jgi:uncharacterized membrane protein YphA (DoxX/SURF4 family)
VGWRIAVLRVTLGQIFLVYGPQKFSGGLYRFVHFMGSTFQGKLPGPLVGIFALALPFVEVLVGACLVYGIYTVGGGYSPSLLWHPSTFSATCTKSA